jgi:predicted HTH domain antitoxin
VSEKMVKIKLDVPEEISEPDKAVAAQKAREAAVLALWEAGAISISRAAEELDLGIHDFLDLLAAKGLPVARGELNLEAIEEASQKLAG